MFQAPNSVPDNFPKLSNLKILKLVIKAFDDDCLLHCAFFLKVSPSLYKFTLKEDSSKPSYEAVKTVKDHPHLSLTKLSVREVELVGFEGLADAEFVMYLIESAELLEKITLDSCLWGFVGTPRESHWRETEECKLGKQGLLSWQQNFLHCNL